MHRVGEQRNDEIRPGVPFKARVKRATKLRRQRHGSDGDWSSAASNGKHSVAMSAGRDGMAKGAKGCALFLVERNDDGEIIAAWAGIVGKKRIKPDTFYTLSNGKPVEVE